VQDGDEERTTMAGRKRRAARVRPGEVVLALAAVGSLAVGLSPAAPAWAATATAFAAPAPGRVTSAVEVPIRAPVEVTTVPAPVVDGSAAAAQVAAGPGMAVPQPPRPTRTGRVIAPYVAVGESPELTVRPAPCGGHTTPRRVAPGVVAGPGSATVSWRAGGRAEVLGYRVSAVSQALVPGVQAAPLQRSVGQPGDCAPVTVTLTGLVPGEAYVFWLEEETVDAATSEVRLVQVGTSQPVVIGS
jgi:hypothetical protein